jgi:murein L,D-transpeptidase YcbB/YkuD
MTIKEDIRAKIIQMSREGKGRNRIVYELGRANIHVSSGSVSNILRNKDQIINPQPTQIDASISTSNNMINTSPSLLNGTELADSNVVNETADETQSKSELEEQIHDLEARKGLLQKQIEENRMILEADKKAAKAFLAVKEEMAKCGIEDGSIQFVKVVQTFRKYGHDPSKIFNSFLEVQDVVIEKENIKRLSEETDHKLRVLERKLEEIGLGDFENLRKIVVSLMTLETYGIGVDQIISYYHRQRNQQILARTRGGRV